MQIYSTVAIIALRPGILKVLHVWNVAGVASILATYLRRRGIYANVITRHGFDPYGFSEAYPDVTTTYSVRARRFYTMVVQQASDYDIIHIHTLDEMAPLVKLCRWKPVVLHYHGSDIRSQGASLKKRVFQWFTNRILVSTPDLLEDIPSATYLPNPVDTNLFYPQPTQPLHNSAVFFLKYPDGEAELTYIQDFAAKQGLHLQTYSRVGGDHVSHNDMPSLYAAHEYFLGRVKLPSLSRMALEALACGIKVWKDDILLTTLPQEHQPDHVIDQLLSIYDNLLDG